MARRRRRLRDLGSTTGRVGGRSLVFSFGSNLSDEQLLRRCPSAITAGRATLPGYRLVFCGWSSGWDGAVATVRRAPGSEVCGELVLLDDADLYRLDSYEGAPRVYARHLLRVRAETRVGTRDVTAWIYIRNGGDENLPSPEYVARISNGYGRLGYDAEGIVRAIRSAQRAVTRRSRALIEEVA